MDDDDRALLNKLHTLQGEAASKLQEVADHMGRIANSPIVISDKRWSVLWGQWEKKNKDLQEVGIKLSAAYKEAMKKQGK